MKRLKLRLQGRMLLVFGAVLALFAVGLAFVFMELQGASSDVNEQNTRAEQAVAITDAGALFRSQYILVSDSLLSGTFDEELYEQQDNVLDEQLALVQEHLTDEAQHQLFQTIQSQKDTFNEMALRFTGSSVQSAGEIETIRDLQQQVYERISQLEEQFAAAQEEARGAAITSIQSVTTLFVLTFAASAVLGLLLFIWFSRRVSRALNRVSARAERISRGDLRAEPQGTYRGDEIGSLERSMETMTDGLRQLIDNVQGVSSSLSAQASQLQTSAGETTSTAGQIAEAIQEVASSTDTQLAAMSTAEKASHSTVARLTSSSREAGAAAVQAVETDRAAADGRKTTARAAGQMDTIRTHTESSNEKVQALTEKSRRIDDIVTVITNLSDQTNLLALNAAIEAARAGESGRGFAVVADEVRKLAEQSGTAAQDISGVIHSIQEDIEEAAASMEEGKTAVQEGVSLVNEAESAFAAISRTAAETSRAMTTLKQAVEESTSRTTSLQNAVQETTASAEKTTAHTQTVAAAAQQSSASMQEVAAASDELNRLSEEVKEELTRFRTA
ncbi:methyl-accepting chemotaxis protein [Alkalicoccus urumqiensis]|uniref:Methyl-accepting chemotaxis protein n=1 Tax=Alkalicoccus urumqiensis TaxID=1548213 RepID=A0A2P6MIC1_ALKUR|nr:methyl-accepting chemotaxis protein [Alkalicoccus urumqiensis]PRO66008.1 hypothetical protein C6I21_06820 [Alkalicoccus urumqiensis]